MKNRFLSAHLALRAKTRKRCRGNYPKGVLYPHETRQTKQCVGPAEFSFKCDGCGCRFPPTPDSFILNTPVRIAEEDADQTTSVGDRGPLNRTALESLNEFELTEWGLTEEERQTLLRGETVFMAADAFCASCLSQLFR